MYIPMNQKANAKRLKKMLDKTFEENKETFKELAEIEAKNLRKVKAFNKISQLYKKKDEMDNRDFVIELGYILEEYEEENINE